MAEFTQATTFADSTQGYPDASAPAAAITPAPAASGAASTALTAVASSIPSIESIRARFAQVFEKARPWSEFANTSQMTRPTAMELKDRMIENFNYYLFNYLCILAVMTIFTVLTSPLSILGVILIFAGYTYLFVMHPDPISLGGSLTLDNNAKSATIVIGSLVVLWITGAGATFTSLLFTLGVLASAHAAIRKAASEADFDTAYEQVGA